MRKDGEGGKIEDEKGRYGGEAWRGDGGRGGKKMKREVLRRGEEGRCGGETRKGSLEGRYGVASLSCSHGGRCGGKVWGGDKEGGGVFNQYPAVSVPPSGTLCHPAPVWAAWESLY